ncbi:MAG: PhoPQ-activated protein PqaA family protein [Terrimicrobiaceae bacterium]
MFDVSFSGVSSDNRGRILGVALLLMTLLAMSESLANALETYVRKPDASFAWKRTEQKKIKDLTLTHLEFISQTWRGHFWSHHLLVVRPTTVRQADVAMLFITGGSYNAPDEKETERFHEVAQRAGAVVAILNKVPNQPLYDGRKEDALIAFTFDQYLKTGDPTWPLLFPMVKSAVRAMDTLQSFARQEFDQKIERFVVSGESKRGWTSWLTGAVDTRVVAIAPMAIDMLNMKAQLDWTEKMYGRQSDQISDYTDLNLHQKLDDPPMQTLRAWVDPYSYRRSYTMPKLLLLGTNDPYWVVDSLRHYWSDLPEPKLVFQTPNAGHDLGGGHDAWQTLAAWFQMIADRQLLPKVEWQVRDGTDGAAGLTVRVDQPANKVRLWTAHSADRDFRDEKWTSRELEIQPGSSQASADVPKPAAGFTAFLAEVELTAPTGHSYKLSTQVQVTPDGVNRWP